MTEEGDFERKEWIVSELVTEELFVVGNSCPWPLLGTFASNELEPLLLLLLVLLLLKFLSGDMFALDTLVKSLE